MHQPKFSKAAYFRLVETGEADDYLSAHAEWAPVYATGSNSPRYDVILDAEASNELFNQFSNGKLSLQNASQDELQAFVENMAGRCQHHHENPMVEQWKALAIRAALIITGLILFVFALMFFALRS